MDRDKLKNVFRFYTGNEDNLNSLLTAVDDYAKEWYYQTYFKATQDDIVKIFEEEYQRFNPNMSDGNKEILNRIANNAANKILSQG